MSLMSSPKTTCTNTLWESNPVKVLVKILLKTQTNVYNF